jgi:hypothetical protein
MTNIGSGSPNSYDPELPEAGVKKTVHVGVECQSKQQCQSKQAIRKSEIRNWYVRN